MIPMNFNAVLSAFQSPLSVQVTDMTGAYQDGQWSETEAGERQISAIVLAMKTADLEFYKQGYATDSGISITTKAELFFVDVNDTGEGQERRQSYVDYQGYRFRVAGTGFMMGNTNTHIYHCLRFTQ